MSSTVLRVGPERARLGVWRGSDRTAYLTPFPGTPPLSAAFVEHTLDEVRARGFRSVVTGALAPAECLGFVDAGFSVHEELALLEHDLHGFPRGSRAVHRPRRAGGSERAAVVAIDAASFNEFWHLDAAGLDEALGATPRTRFRVVDGGQGLTGYAIVGRAGPRGYIQRLAVAPQARRNGVGRALVDDALDWMARRGVRRALVNTHLDNQAALALYRSCGFRVLPTPLRILTRTV